MKKRPYRHGTLDVVKKKPKKTTSVLVKMAMPKPCRRCGGDPITAVCLDDLWSVDCMKCGLSVGFFRTEGEAIKAWDGGKGK